MKLRSQGYTHREIEAKIGVSDSTLSRWFSNFVAEETTRDMKKPRRVKVRRAVGVQAPENSNTIEYSAASSGSQPEDNRQEGDRERIARLEKELKESRLKADLYKEIIDVSEKRYGINLLKKAGAKQ